MSRLTAALGPVHNTLGGLTQQGFQGGLAAQARTGEAIRDTLARIGANALQSAEFRARLQAANAARRDRAAQRMQESLQDTISGVLNREFAKEQSEEERRHEAAQNQLERENRREIAGIRAGDLGMDIEKQFAMASTREDLAQLPGPFAAEYDAYVRYNTPEGGDPPTVAEYRDARMAGLFPYSNQAQRDAALTTTRDNTAEQVMQGYFNKITQASDENTREQAVEQTIEALRARQGLVSPSKAEDLIEQASVITGMSEDQIRERMRLREHEATYGTGAGLSSPWLWPKRFIADPITNLAGLDVLGLPGPQTLFERLGRRFPVGEWLRGGRPPASTPQPSAEPMLSPGQFIESLRPPPDQRGQQPPLMFQGPPVPGALSPIPPQQDVVDAILRQRNRQLRRE